MSTRFAIGAQKWSGLSKLVEECGELQQVLGKLLGTYGEVEHWDGSNLRDRLVEEIGDTYAAIEFFTRNLSDEELLRIDARRQLKLQLFREWHVQRRVDEKIR